MRIGIDARELGGEATGVGRYLAELLARWTRDPGAAGHFLFLYTPRPLPADAGWRGVGGAAVDEIVAPGHGGTWWEQGALASALRRVPPHVFFAPGYTAPILIRTPVVLSMHDVSFAAHPEWFPWRSALRQRAVAWLAARRATRLVTLTEFSKREIALHLSVPASRIEVVTPGVDTHAALLPPREPGGDLEASPDGTAVVLYVGTMFTRRHVPELIDAFAAVARERPHLRLVLVGQDRTWPPQQIGGRILATRLHARIEWHRWLAEKDLRAQYRRARAFAFLSEYEGFGLTPLEAIAADVPPLVADVPVAHEAYGDAAVYVDPGDVRAVAVALAAVLEDRTVRTRVLNAAPAVLRRYSWDRAAARTFDILLAAGDASR